MNTVWYVLVGCVCVSIGAIGSALARLINAKADEIRSRNER